MGRCRPIKVIVNERPKSRSASREQTICLRPSMEAGHMPENGQLRVRLPNGPTGFGGERRFSRVW